MKFAWKILLLTLFIISFSFSDTQDATSIAVLNFEALEMSSGEVNILSRRITSLLVETKKFTVTDRNNMESILEEQSFQLSGCTSSECIVEVGQLLGVQKMLSGSIGQLGQIYMIEMYIIDVATGKIDASSNSTIKGEIELLIESGLADALNKLLNTEVKNNIIVVEEKKLIPEPKLQSVGLVNSELPGRVYVINPVGLLLFGPSASINFQIKEGVYAGPRIRYSAFGLVYNLVASSFQSNYDLHNNSMALGFDITRLKPTKGTNRYWYSSAFIEYDKGSYTGDVGETFEWDGEFANLVIGASNGYRWEMKAGPVLQIGLLSGYAIGLYDEWHYSNSNYYDVSELIKNEPLSYMVFGLDFAIIL